MYNKIIQVKKLINQYIINTQCSISQPLSEITSRNIFVKYENKQHTGSFKYRGSINKLLMLNKEQKKRGVIAIKVPAIEEILRGVSLLHKKI